MRCHLAHFLINIKLSGQETLRFLIKKLGKQVLNHLPTRDPFIKFLMPEETLLPAIETLTNEFFQEPNFAIFYLSEIVLLNIQACFFPINFFSEFVIDF
jgi:hypothetical protein